MTDLGTVVFFTLMALQVLPGLSCHIYVHHVLWNRMPPKEWSTAMRQSSENPDVQFSIFSVLASLAILAASMLAYAVYYTDPNRFPILVAAIVSFIVAAKYYTLHGKKNTSVGVCFIVVLALLLLKSDYKGTFILHYINECAMMLAYTELFITSILMNKTYIKTFKSVSNVID